MNKLKLLLSIILLLFFLSCEENGNYFLPYKDNVFKVHSFESYNVNTCTYYVKNRSGGFYIKLPCNYKVNDTLYLRTINCR